MRNVALDLGAGTISYSESRDGKIIDRTTVRSMAALADRLGPNTPPARVMFEACREGWIIYDRLKAAGHDPIMVDTTRSKQLGIGHHKRKTDRIDADALVMVLERGGRIPVAHVLSPHRRELRFHISVRRVLVESRAQSVALVREIARARGHRVPSCAVDDFVAKLRTTKLDEATRSLVAPVQQILEHLNQQIRIVDAKLEQLCLQEPVITQLMTVPGVGPIVAASFVSVIDEAHRFRNAHQVEAYIGLVPSEDSSGGRRRVGSITKQGNSYLRAMLVQAAWLILRLKDDRDPLHAWGVALEKRRGKRIAVVGIARRLAGVLWAVWRHDSIYDPTKLTAGREFALAINEDKRAAHRAALLQRAAKKFHHRRPIADRRANHN